MARAWLSARCVAPGGAVAFAGALARAVPCPASAGPKIFQQQGPPRSNFGRTTAGEHGRRTKTPIKTDLSGKPPTPVADPALLRTSGPAEQGRPRESCTNPGRRASPNPALPAGPAGPAGKRGRGQAQDAARRHPGSADAQPTATRKGVGQMIGQCKRFALQRHRAVPSPQLRLDKHRARGSHLWRQAAHPCREANTSAGGGGTHH